MKKKKTMKPCSTGCGRLTVLGVCSRCRNQRQRERMFYVNSRGRLKTRDQTGVDPLDMRLPGSFESNT